MTVHSLLCAITNWHANITGNATPLYTYLYYQFKLLNRIKHEKLKILALMYRKYSVDFHYNYIYLIQNK